MTVRDGYDAAPHAGVDSGGELGLARGRADAQRLAFRNAMRLGIGGTDQRIGLRTKEIELCVELSPLPA